VGIGFDFGGYPKSQVGVENIYYTSEFSEFSSGIYVTGGPLSVTFTESSKNIGISKSWGFGIAYVTCFNIYISCK
jgi:hypothetical protein